MRIVAGSAKGRRLVGPAGVTRPTSDRVREALFNSLASQVHLEGARVLDLFAGTGAVGLEALSRGAGRVVLVESDREAAQAARRNAATVETGRGEKGAEVVQRPVHQFLTHAPEGEFDVVFLDPPYAFDESSLREVLVALVRRNWLAPGAVVVVERSALSPMPPWPDGVAALRDRRYGDGVLWYGRRDETALA